MRISAKLNNIRISPRKTRIVAKLIKGLDVDDALDQLNAHVKKTSPLMKKLLESAIVNGENNAGLDKSNMYVFEVKVNAGSSLKRWMPKAFGRAGRIIKRTSKIEIILEERVEGKGRKSKEQMEKEKITRMEEKKKIEKEMQKDQKKTEKKQMKSGKTESTDEIKEEELPKSKSKGQNKGWANRIFRRKSM